MSRIVAVAPVLPEHTAAQADITAELADVLPRIQERVRAGERLKDVCAEVAAATGLSKKQLYDAALAAR